MEALQALGIYLPSLLWHTVNFIVLVLLLTKFLYKPIVRILDERATRIKESVERAEAIKEQLASTTEQSRLQLEAARREGQAIVDQASQIAESLKGQARQDAQAEGGQDSGQGSCPDRVGARAGSIRGAQANGGPGGHGGGSGHRPVS